MGLATYVNGRYEADDLIATLCRQLVRRGHDVIVVSCDKDLTQLVNPRVCFFDYARERRMGEREVYGQFGVWPEQIPDYLGLAGDAVDSIPGVRGVGPKTAVALLDAFGDIDTLYASLDEVSDLPVRGASTLGAKLSEQRDMAFLSRDLATVAIDAPVKASLRELAVAGADPELLDPLLEELGFRSVRRRIPIWQSTRG
jgi:5'-3' exonuclease